MGWHDHDMNKFYYFTTTDEAILSTSLRPHWVSFYLNFVHVFYTLLNLIVPVKPAQWDLLQNHSLSLFREATRRKTLCCHPLMCRPPQHPIPGQYVYHHPRWWVSFGDFVCRKTPESAPPALSMRALIAEAEAENKHSKLQPVIKVIDDRYVGHFSASTAFILFFVFYTMSLFFHRPVKRQPVVKPHQPVSFASIIKSQESERNRNRYVY